MLSYFIVMIPIWLVLGLIGYVIRKARGKPMSEKPPVATVPLAAMGKTQELKNDRQNPQIHFVRMDKTLFQTRIISVFHESKYVFYEEIQRGEPHNFAQKQGGVLRCPHNFTNENVKVELAKLVTLCDFMGIRSDGEVRLILFVYADDLADETIIGKCSLIRDRLTSFKQFAWKVGWVRHPVFADVFFIFGNSERAFHFRQSVQEHCKHSEFFKKTHVVPWGIDFSAKSVWGYKGSRLLHSKYMESKLFSES